MLLKALCYDKTVRVICANTKEIVQNAVNIHKTLPTATAALGRTLTMGAIMGSMLKNDHDKLTLQIKGDGPIGGIVVCSNSKSDVKGYVYNPAIDIPPNAKGKLDVGGAIGSGYLNVIKDIGLREPYVGYIPLQTGEIGDDFAYYFAKSEQTPTAVSVGVLVDVDGSVLAAGGYIIEIMPDCEEKTISKLEQINSTVQTITNYLSKNMNLIEIMKLVTGDDNLEIIEERHARYLCDCSQERIERALVSLGKDEIKDIIETQGKAQIYCNFCDTTYDYGKEDLEKLLE